MWSCAATNTVHAQRSCLTVAQLAFAEWSLSLTLNLFEHLNYPNFLSFSSDLMQPGS